MTTTRPRVPARQYAHSLLETGLLSTLLFPFPNSRVSLFNETRCQRFINTDKRTGFPSTSHSSGEISSKKKKENETKRRNIGLRNVSKHAGSSAHLRSILGPSSVTIPPLNPKIYNTQNPKTYSFLLQFQKISSRSLRNIR